MQNEKRRSRDKDNDVSKIYSVHREKKKNYL